MPISAKLLFDDQAKSDVGILSADLYQDLFSSRPLDDDVDQIQYIALTPWVPPLQRTVEDASWTIIPIRVQQGEASTSKHSSLVFSPNSAALQGFARTVQAGPQFMTSKAGLEVLVIDVQPVPLQTIYIKLDGDALRKHDDVQAKFGGGFVSNGRDTKGKGKQKALPDRENDPVASTQKEFSEKRIRDAVRAALAKPSELHKDDLISLPFPAHPITHVPFPPVRVAMCEPVHQGSVLPETRIVLNVDYESKSSNSRMMFPASAKSLRQQILVDGDETLTDHFFSASENKEREPKRLENDSHSEPEESTTSPTDESDEESSDDSSENMISLSSPSLPFSLSDSNSIAIYDTPRMPSHVAGGLRTPGSVYSTFSNTTIRQGGRISGMLFNTRALIVPIPNDILYPRPSSDEDQEARIYVDMKLLVKLKCFSGDWIKLIRTPHCEDEKDAFWGVGAFEDDASILEEHRAVKVYGLANTGVKGGMVYDKRQPNRRRSSVTRYPVRSTPEAYLSPILLANLGNPLTVRLTPLVTTTQNAGRVTRAKVENSALPPLAKEITLLRVTTPLSTERAMQAGILAGLKQFLERKRRIVRSGDLLPIRFNKNASRILLDATLETAKETEELLSNSFKLLVESNVETDIVWFRVGQILMPSNEGSETTDSAIWGVVSVDSHATRISQTGNEQSKLPSSPTNPWKTYLGCAQPPRLSFPTPVLLPYPMISNEYISPVQKRVRGLVSVATNPRANQLNLEPIVILLHSTQRSIGKSYVVMTACADLGIHPFPIDAYDILSEGGAGGGDVKTEASLRAKLERAMSCGAEYTVPIIQHLEVLTADRIASALKDALQDVRILVMTTNDVEKVPLSIRSLFTHEIRVQAPDETEREGILRIATQQRGLKLAYDVELGAIAVKTAALVAGDLVDIVERAMVARQERLEDLLVASHIDAPDTDIQLRDLLVSGGGAARCVTKADFEIAVDAGRKNFADAIGAPKIPNVSWDDVGGLTHVKEAVMETIQLPLERPELFAKGMKKRSGILFYGPPGTGKTLLAKAIATEFSLNFFSVKGPELLNMYIGESEANVRRVFQKARDARPCVVFFDELDSVAPKRGNQGDSGGVMDRIVSQLLAELDGMSNGEDGAGGVFVIGATNRPDLLDQALLRPGRFDKMLYLGISDTHDKQLTILEALTRKFTLHPRTSRQRVAESLPFTYTGADLYALCSDAMLKAITRQAAAVDDKITSVHGGRITPAYFFDHFATKADTMVMVTEEDFFDAQRELVGSVRWANFTLIIFLWYPVEH